MTTRTDRPEMELAKGAVWSCPAHEDVAIQSETQPECPVCQALEEEADHA